MAQRKYILSLLALCLVLPACSGLKRPSVNPARMASDTLCYRAETGHGSTEIRQEIKRRNLDCRAMIENDPLAGEKRY
mgnify:CR=1 FL=1